MLRVLGQRFPQEVDAAVARVSRTVAKAKAAALKQGAQSDDDDDGKLEAVRREAVLREEALSSLLVSTFAGAELAQRLPLQQQPTNHDVSTCLVQSGAFFLFLGRTLVGMFSVLVLEEFPPARNLAPRPSDTIFGCFGVCMFWAKLRTIFVVGFVIVTLHHHRRLAVVFRVI